MSTYTLANFDDLWDYNNPAETEKKFRALLPEAEKELAYHLEVLTQIARTHSLRRDFEAAHQLLDEVYNWITADLKQVYVRYLLERGRTFNSSGSPNEAYSLFLEAWEKALSIDAAYHAVDAAHMLGIAAPSEERLSWNLKALKLAEESEGTRANKWCGSLYNNIGWAYHDQKAYETALSYFQKALEWQEKTENLENIKIAKWCIGRTLRSLGRVEEALALQKNLLAEIEASGGNDGFTNEEVGECLRLLNKAEEARPYFAKAYQLLSQDTWLVAEEPERLERLEKLQGGEGAGEQG